MGFDHIMPNDAPVVTVEWLDVTYNSDTPALERRWTDGRLLSKRHISEGKRCIVLGSTWDEGGWKDFDTIPVALVVDIIELGA